MDIDRSTLKRATHSQLLFDDGMKAIEKDRVEFQLESEIEFVFWRLPFCSYTHHAVVVRHEQIDDLTYRVVQLDAEMQTVFDCQSTKEIESASQCRIAEVENVK